MERHPKEQDNVQEDDEKLNGQKKHSLYREALMRKTDSSRNKAQRCFSPSPSDPVRRVFVFLPFKSKI